MRVDGLAQHISDLLKADVALAEVVAAAFLLGTGEASANIQKGEVEAQGLALFEHALGTTDSVVIRHGVHAAGAYMEAHANHINANALGSLEEGAGGVEVSTELSAKAVRQRRGQDGSGLQTKGLSRQVMKPNERSFHLPAHRLGVIGEDAQNHLCIGINLMNLVQLIRVIECHEMDAMISGIPDVRDWLAGVGVYDIGRGHAKLEHGVDLAHAGAIEAPAEWDESPQELRVGVALDGIEWSLKE